METIDETRDRILRVAGETFAQAGFQSATVREICERANVNVAAVNYHFRDKLGLYTEVLRESLVHESFPPPASLDPKDALREFIRTMMVRLLRAGSVGWQMHIMAREMVQPTPALKAVIEQTIRPKSEWLRGTISKISGISADDIRVRQSAFSVVGQCLMYRIGAPVLRELWPDVAFGEAQAERIADHITDFSLHGIDGLTKKARKDGGK